MENERGFEKDVFTFTRIIFRSNFALGGRFRGGWSSWVNDHPDSDLNLSWRLQLLASLKVDPDTRVVKLSAEELFDFPFIYMVKPGRMELRDAEIAPLRKYLLNGGALLTDDTWGESEWQNIVHEMQRGLPGRTWTVLPREHGVFHCVFRLDKNKLQMPPIQRGLRTGSSSRTGEETPEAFFAPCSTIRAGSWCSRRTTPTGVTAGNARARTPSISRRSPRREPTRWR